ncbi:hypothetical protein JW711_04475, partial [Candidatus Woesearchaeota archaeon]|nr:hypothetical protein [Candidatus Woesearchaeota archaeon]
LSATICFLFVKDLIDKKPILPLIVKYFKKYIWIVLIPLIFAAIYFLPFQMIYGMEIVNNVPQWGDTKIEDLGIGALFDVIRNIFFNFSNPIYGIVGLVSLVGLLGMIFTKKTKSTFFMLSIFAAMIILLEHHLITRPLLDWYFWPYKLTYFSPMIILTFVFGIITLLQFIPKKYRVYLFATSILLLALVFYVRFGSFASSQWEQVGRGDNSHITALYGLGHFIQNTVSPEETILSNDESGFMLAVLSGRKVMLTRRTHASYFVDIDQRIADAAVAMYGNDTGKTLEILRKYKVKYFYLDSYLLQYPYRVRPDLASYLEENSINFTRVHDRYDIAMPIDKATLQDLLIIPAQPLSPQFSSLWEQIYPVMYNGQQISSLMKLKENASEIAKAAE